MTSHASRAHAWEPRSAAPGFASTAYPSPVVRRLQAGWRRLCEDERDSVIAASMVATDLARLGAPSRVMGAAARVIEDEIRHVDVCTRVLERLGTEPDTCSADNRRVELVAGAATPARCATALIAGFAVGEPMSAACFAAALRRAEEPLLRWALTELLRDEARHGAFGVEAGEWVIRQWRPEERLALWPACVEEMQAFERAVGGPVTADVPCVSDPVAGRLGLLNSDENCAAAVACIPRWVLPGLRRIGVAPPAARPRQIGLS